MSRLGGAAAVAPLVADMSSEVTCSISLSLFLFSPAPERISGMLSDFTADATVPRVPHREMTRLPSRDDHHL
jgi:hypothetical protein